MKETLHDGLKVGKGVWPLPRLTRRFEESIKNNFVSKDLSHGNGGNSRTDENSAMTFNIYNTGHSTMGMTDQG